MFFRYKNLNFKKGGRKNYGSNKPYFNKNSDEGKKFLKEYKDLDDPTKVEQTSKSTKTLINYNDI